MGAYIVETKKLQHNLTILKEKAKTATIWGVVKGNGYGLGAADLALVLRNEGINHFAVTAISEARALREAGLTTEPILMLRATSNREELEEMTDLQLICTIGAIADAEALENICREKETTVQAHVKLDTGMGRFGFLTGETETVASLYRDYPHIHITGIYTHFHSGSNPEVTEAQFRTFSQEIASLKAMGIDVGMVHCCNSLAFWNFPHMHLDGVRLGSCLLGRVGYGRRAGLQSVGYGLTQVEALKTLPKGHNVGYSRGCRLKRESRVAVVGIGYIHGFSVERGYDVFRLRDCLRSMARYLKYLLKRRRLTVEVNGHTCPVLGHVGMVNMVVDVTDIPCALHDPVKVQINPLDLKELDIRYES